MPAQSSTSDTNTVFILDTYNKYARNENVRYIFRLYDNWYAIKEVELEWGRPALDRIDVSEYDTYHLFNSYEEAYAAAQELKRGYGSGLENL